MTLNPNQVRALLYPKQVWYCVACFIFLVCLGNIASLLSARHRRQQAASRYDVHQDTGREQSVGKAVSWRRLPAAVASAWKIFAYRSVLHINKDCTFTLFEVFIVVAYLGVILAWSLMNTTNAKTGVHFDLIYMGNRAGNIATTQLPLVIALGMRNNIISVLTGISFEKLNFLHRMLARILMPVIWLHAGCRLGVGLKKATTLSNPYQAAGVLAAIPWTLLCLFFWSPIRRRGYEIFYMFHMLTVLLLLFGAYFHARAWDLGHYVLPSLGLWAFDRLLRILRLIAFNHAYLGFTSGVGTFNATVELVADGVVRLRFRRPSHLHWLPGQTAWVTMPSVSALPFESHPFTIATADLPQEEIPLSEKGENRSLSAEGKELAFIIQTREGFTRRLGQIASTSGTLKIFFDGPYSSPPRLAYYDTVVLLAGGTGVSFTNSLFVDLIYRARKDPAYCRSVVFIWAIRDPDLVNAIYEDLARALKDSPPSLRVSVRIHITRASSNILTSKDAEDRASSTGSEKESARDLVSRLPHTETLAGRPDVEGILEEFASSARGPVAVAVCGPSGLTLDTRRVLRERSLASPMTVLKGGPNIDLFVETFSA